MSWYQPKIDFHTRRLRATAFDSMLRSKVVSEQLFVVYEWESCPKISIFVAQSKESSGKSAGAPTKISMKQESFL